MSEVFTEQKNKIYPEMRVNNFREFLDITASKYKDRTAFMYKKDMSSKEPEYISISFEKHKKDVEAFSTKLLEMGLESKKIAIISHNKYEWPLSYMAVNTGGMVVVPLDYLLPQNEIESLLIRSKAEAVIFDKTFVGVFTDIKNKKNTNLKYYICMDTDEDKDEILSLHCLLSDGYKLIEKGSDMYQKVKIDEKKMSVMIFTSGTTDTSKAVMLSQKNICSNISAMTTLIKYEKGDSVLSFLPMHHTFECTATYLFCSFVGFKICYCDGLRYIGKNINEYHVSGLVCVPAVLDIMYRQIQRTIEKRKLTHLFNALMRFSNALYAIHIDLRRILFKSLLDNMGGNIRTIIYGSSSASVDVIKFFNSIGVRMIQGYGLTETSPVISCESDKYQRYGSAGKPLYNVDVKIINKNEDGVGEITVNGPNVMLGYYENGEKTNEVLKDGYFHTGDLGYIDKDGFLFVTGRIKDLIVLNNGKKIFPQELELMLNKSPLIEESFVYLGKKGENEKISVKIIYNPDVDDFKEKDEKQIFEILKAEVAKVNSKIPLYKNIKNIIVSTEPLIKTTTQKIKRHEEMKKI